MVLEFWDFIPGHPNYYVSDYGNVWSIRRNKELKQNLRGAYASVTIGRKSLHIHRLVATVFCDRKEGCNVVNHLNCDKLDNRAINMEWTTPRGNSQYLSHLRKHKLKPVHQLKDGIVMNTYVSVKEAVKKTDLRQSGISRCLTGAIRSSGGCEWKYASSQRHRELEPGGKTYQGFDNYIFTRDGRVYSRVSQVYLSLQEEAGYLRVRIRGNGKSKALSVHRAVAELYVPNPHNLKIVNHKNGMKDDNRAENLEWCTHEYNSYHACYVLKKGISPVAQYTKDGKLVATHESMSKASEKTDIHNISAAVRGKYNTAGGFI